MNVGMPKPGKLHKFQILSNRREGSIQATFLLSYIFLIQTGFRLETENPAMLLGDIGIRILANFLSEFIPSKQLSFLK